MVQDGGTPSDKKNKSHDLQKKITGLEHEMELRFVLTLLTYAVLEVFFEVLCHLFPASSYAKRKLKGIIQVVSHVAFGLSIGPRFAYTGRNSLQRNRVCHSKRFT